MKSSKNSILLVFLLVLFFMWGSFFIPGSPLPSIFFLNLTENKPFTIKEVANEHPRIEWQTFVTVRYYPDIEKTYVFFEYEPLPSILEENGIRKEKAEEIVESISKNKVYGTYLIHKGNVLYWRVFISGTRDYYDVNVTTGKVEESGSE